MRLASSKQQASSSAGPFLGPKAAGVPKSKKKLHVIRDGISQLSRQLVFFLVGPPPVGNGDLVVFRPVLGLGHLQKFRAQAENTKMQFPGALFRGGIRPPQKFLKLRNFVTISVVADRTPRGGKSRNTGYWVLGTLGHFGLGQALGLGTWRNSGRKTGKSTISRVQRACYLHDRNTVPSPRS